MRFKIDENLPDALVALLAEKGHDACTARQLFETEPLDGHLWIVEENRVRVWRRW